MASNVVKCTSCNLVINEVLAFICNKIDVMDEPGITQICVSAFSESEILDAKNLLFESITTSKRKKIRKRLGKTQRDIDDIVCLLKETDPEEIPVFVARDLQKLPPVLFDHVDVTRILKDIVRMRSDLDRFSKECATLDQLKELRSDIESLKTASIVNNFSRNVNMTRGATCLPSFECESGPMGLSPLCTENKIINKHSTASPIKSRITFSEEGKTKIPTAVHFVSNGSPAVTASESTIADRLSADGRAMPSELGHVAVAAAALPTTCAADMTNITEDAGTIVIRAHENKQNSDESVKKLFSNVVTGGQFKTQVPNEDWILVQRRRLRNRFVGKSGKAIVDNNFNFKAAENNIPIYLYNVSKETSECDIKNYIKNQCNLETQVEKDVSFLGSIDPAFSFTGKSAVDTSAGVLRGRPYGGVALLWRSAKFSAVTVIPCRSDRLVAVKIVLSDRSFIVASVYIPTDKNENLTEFTECLSELNAIIESASVESVVILGDFNAHPGELLCNELCAFCADQLWSCVDLELLPLTTYTFVSEAHGCRRWLDHCVVTSAARPLILNVSVLYDTYWSDHYPLLVECNLNIILPKIVKSNSNNSSQSGVTWGIRDSNQVSNYHSLCNSDLKNIDFPIELSSCADKICKNKDHTILLNNLYNDIVNILSKAAKNSCQTRRKKKHKYVTGWNKHVKAAHRRARLCFQKWVACGRPISGNIFQNMTDSRKMFKNKLKYCQNNATQIKMDMIAENHANKDFTSFWKNTNKLNPRSSLPVNVGGSCEPRHIACVFQQSFRVVSPLGGVSQMLDDEVFSGDLTVRFSSKDVVNVIAKMERGKSPGYDGLSIEHLRHAGVHLPRVLSMLFNLCISHSYLPENLMRTVVVPIVKNKSGDHVNVSNYRPISLATIVAKVLDSLLDQQLAKHVNLHDAQFGFRPGLSTESAIFCLKQTVQYYTARKTPVYACYLDLSKAFDLVNYDKLWQKLRNETSVPHEVTSLFKYWYSNQQNTVRWGSAMSDVYLLECGVRQGGLSSPRLFNLYINRLIGELSGTNVGCSVDGISINNVSYADDTVLLSPSIAALRKLLRICEEYADTHGLRYNVNKSELMIFKAGAKTYSSVPQVTLYGSPLNLVKQFKYLGHWVTDDLCDNVDVERERRALSVRCNMLARRFARCTVPVKVTLFKAYCQSFYTCSLWLNFTQRACGALRVQYNNAFRILLGLPRFCSASTMFAEAHADDFYAIVRKRSASLLGRLRGCGNGILNVLVERWDSPLLRRWMHLHTHRKLVFMLLITVMTGSYCCLWFLPMPEPPEIEPPIIKTVYNLNETVYLRTADNTTTLDRYRCNWNCSDQEFHFYLPNATFVNTIFVDDVLTRESCARYGMDVGNGGSGISCMPKTDCSLLCFENDLEVNETLLFRGRRAISNLTNENRVVLDSNKEVISSKYVDSKATKMSHGKVELEKEDPSFYMTTTFWAFVILMCLGTVAFNVANCIGDAVCFDVLGPEKASKYGAQRAWGTAGYGITALLGGWLVDAVSRGASKDFAPAFILALAATAVDLYSCRALTLPSLSSPEDSGAALRQVLRMPRVLVFIAFAVVAGTFDSFIIYYMFWFLEELAEETGSMEKIKLIEGVVVAGQSFIGELLFFYFSGRIIKRFGYGTTMTVSLCCYGVRMALISLIQHPWHLVFIESIMQGPTYALCYSTIVGYAAQVAPEGYSATVQGIVAGMDDGVGFALGSLVGGVLYSWAGGRGSFRILASVAVVASIAHVVLFKLVMRNADKEKQTAQVTSQEEGQKMLPVDQDYTDAIYKDTVVPLSTSR
ncbi:hypothetical protein evm_008991 [Chilo suppressalis]|nr:hypothetical protein evm_008991 [Chilo suppressalis]